MAENKEQDALVEEIDEEESDEVRKANADKVEKAKNGKLPVLELRGEKAHYRRCDLLSVEEQAKRRNL